MGVDEIIEICKANREKNKNEELKNRCKGCKFWKNTEGCAFYNRPFDWKVKEQK